MTSVSRQAIETGDYGSVTTLNRMRGLVNDALMQPSVVERATGIVSMVPSRDYVGMAGAIRGWLARNFKFVPDPVGVELLRDPAYQLAQMDVRGMVLGDCDDAAILGAALAKSVGIRASFVAVGFQAGGPLMHVYTVLTGPAAGAINWSSPISLDVTRPAGNRARAIRRVVVVV